MVDRKARNRLAETGRQLATGVMSTGRFESLLPFPTDDVAVEEIWDNLFDSLYSDFWPPWSHRLTGRRRLDPAIRSIVARAIVFLHSEVEYDPESFHAKFDRNLWPFVSTSALESARARPRLLCGIDRA